MIKLTSKKTIDSVTFPGVSFTIRVLTEGVRSRLRLRLAEPLAKMRDLNQELERIEIPKDDSNGVDPYVFAKIMRITDMVEHITSSEINPPYFDLGFVSVQGLEIDDIPADQLTGDLVKELAPNALYNEIVDAIKNGSEMTSDETKNSDSPTISADAAVGREMNTTASPANATSCT